MELKIISGGQTGADRAALDFAIAHGLPHGGWCPRGRLAEDGRISGRYLLTETPSSDSAQRTEWNVRDADATVIFSMAANLTGGSRKTREFAAQYGKPCLHVSRERDGAQTATKVSSFLAQHGFADINIAGPRQSEEPGIAGFVRETLEKILTGQA